MLKRDDSGFTLVELLVTLVIMMLIVLLLSRTLSSASSSLAKTSEQSLRAQEAMRFVRLVKYDIQGSKDLYVFGVNTPAAGEQTYMCSPLRSSGNVTASWAAIGATVSSSSQGIRPLFSVLVRDFDLGGSGYNRTSPAAPAGWLTTVDAWIGYEIRRAPSASGSTPYQIWRVVCSDSGGVPNSTEQSSEFVMNLGTTIDDQVSGSSVIACPGADGSFAVCPVQQSTSTIPWYSLSLPLSTGQNQSLGRDVATQLNVVTRMVGR